MKVREIWTVPILFLLFVLFFSAWVRFDGISRQGVAPGDSFEYLKEAKFWADGETPKFLKGRFYRPVSYFLQGKALRLFGYNDYAIKILNSGMDLISILLVFVILSLLTGNLWAGVAGALLYSFLPAIVSQARWEMLHAESTFFSLWAFLFFVLSVKRKTGDKADKVYFLFLAFSGLCVGLAANTHPDMAFLAVGYVLYLLTVYFNRGQIKEWLQKFIIRSFIFSISFFVPYAVGFFLFGPDKVIRVILNEGSLCTGFMTDLLGHVSKPGIFYDIFAQLLRGYFGKQFILTAILLVCAVFIMVYRKVKKENDPPWLYLAPVLLFSYAFCFCYILKTSPEQRVLMPLVPLVIFIIVPWFHQVFAQFPSKYSTLVFFSLFVIVFLLNPKMLPGQTPDRSPIRFIYDILGQEVNPRNKLLIAPVIVWDGKGFQHEFYFGREGAIYLAALPIDEEYNLKSLSDLLKNKRIRYIFLDYNDMQTVLLKPGCPIPLKSFRNWLRNDKFQYSLEKDFAIIREYIRLRGGIPISDTPYGKLYKLTDKKQGKTGSEQGNPVKR
ncbi:MAG TPA: glycosyltransferase family 39 protein [Candidatus Deferrimicrobium sp.]|nr:glycosyltransferase family 39 protein [Candidatus Deferrimicrobium sp.]